MRHIWASNIKDPDLASSVIRLTITELTETDIGYLIQTDVTLRRDRQKTDYGRLILR